MRRTAVIIKINSNIIITSFYLSWGEYGSRTPPFVDTLSALADRLEIYEIAPVIKLHDILSAERDTVVGVRLGVKAQGLGSKALNATGRAGIVDLVKVVRIPGLFTDTLQMSLSDYLNLRCRLPPSCGLAPLSAVTRA